MSLGSLLIILYKIQSEVDSARQMCHLTFHHDLQSEYSAHFNLSLINPFFPSHVCMLNDTSWLQMLQLARIPGEFLEHMIAVYET